MLLKIVNFLTTQWIWVVGVLIPYTKQRRAGQVREAKDGDSTYLKRALPSWQIVMIAIGGVIGITIFSTQGEILRLAGPAGLLSATVFVSAVAICVMDCLGELVILWPVSNAMVEYVRAFIDEDLAVAVGVAYWYTMSCVFSTLTIVAADFASYTITHDSGRYALFYGVIPACLLGINLVGVEYYGFIEGVGGIVKILLVIIGIIFMIYRAAKVGSIYFDEGFQAQDGIAENGWQAICIGIPLIVYGFIGTEIWSVTAFEAIDRSELRFPARWVAYILALAYILSAVLQGFIVGYTNPSLQNIGEIARDASSALPQKVHRPAPSFYATIVIAAREDGSNSLGWFFNGCIIYFCISAANTALYVASRTLYGLTRHLTREKSNRFPKNILRHFGETTNGAKVPSIALMFSFIAFFWLVPLQLSTETQITDMLKIMGTMASISGVMVWASQCLAYIRYYRWFRRCKNATTETNIFLPAEYDRWQRQPDEYEEHQFPMLLNEKLGLKLLPAAFGLVGTLLIVFIFSTAAWWYHRGAIPFKYVASAFAGPLVLSFIFVIRKLAKGRLFQRWYVELPVDRDVFRRIIGTLEENARLRYPSNLESGQAQIPNQEHEGGIPMQSISDAGAAA